MKVELTEFECLSQNECEYVIAALDDWAVGVSRNNSGKADVLEPLWVNVHRLKIKLMKQGEAASDQLGIPMEPEEMAVAVPSE